MKLTKKKFSGSKTAIVFYVLSVILLLYGTYMIFNVYEYLVSYYESYGVSMGSAWEDNIQYFVSNCSQYFIYAVLCYGVGAILQLLHEILGARSKAEVVEEVVEEVENEVVETRVEFSSAN